MNITKLPSHVQASQFSSPRDLANYLLYLDNVPGEYQKYVAWRQQRQPFTKEYLQTLKYRVPGAQEVSTYLSDQGNNWFNFRQPAASCCRLCDENFLKTTEVRREYKPVKKFLSKNEVIRRFMWSDWKKGIIHRNITSL